MVRAISGVIFVLLFIVLLVFWMQNYTAFTTPVEIKFNIIFYKIPPLQLQVWALMLVMLAVGVLLTFFCSIDRMGKYSFQVTASQPKNEKDGKRTCWAEGR